MVAHEFNGLIADGVGVKILGGLVFGIIGDGDESIVAKKRAGVPKATRAVDCAVITVETAAERPVRAIGWIGESLGGLSGCDMPLTDTVGTVAGGFEHFGNGGRAVQAAAVTLMTAILHHVADAGLMGITAGEERRASGATAGGVVELSKTEAVPGERVEIGRLNFAAVATDIREADVVGENDDDVRTRSFRFVLRAVNDGAAHQDSKNQGDGVWHAGIEKDYGAGTKEIMRTRKEARTTRYA